MVVYSHVDGWWTLHFTLPIPATTATIVMLGALNLTRFWSRGTVDVWLMNSVVDGGCGREASKWLEHACVQLNK